MQKLIRFWTESALTRKVFADSAGWYCAGRHVAIVTLYIPLRAYDRQSLQKQRSDDFPVRRADSGRTDEL